MVTLEVMDGKTVHRDSVKLTGSVSPANSDVVIEGDSDSIEAKVKHGRFSATVRDLGVGPYNDVTVTASAPDEFKDASHDLTLTRKRSHAELLALARAKAERKRRAAQRRREAALRRAYGLC